jgi:hypothetical protein
MSTPSPSSSSPINKYRICILLALLCSLSVFQLSLVLGSAAPRTSIMSIDVPLKPPDTTVVITSSLIPSHPSLRMINDTIISVRTHLLGLHPKTPFIFAIDGLKSSATDNDRQRYDAMVDYLHSNYSSALILTKNASEGLTKNIKRAVDYVETKYVYLVQHDLIFALDINHTAMVKTFEEYPHLMNVVRFNLRKNMFRFSDRRYPCFGERSPMNNVNGISFTKTGHWSDKYVLLDVPVVICISKFLSAHIVVFLLSPNQTVTSSPANNTTWTYFESTFPSST